MGESSSLVRLHGILEMRGLAKSLKSHESNRENVNKMLQATRALLFSASFVASVQQLQAHAAAVLAMNPGSQATANIFSIRFVRNSFFEKTCKPNSS